MNEIKCPYDLNQFLFGEPRFENLFPEEECEQRKLIGDCYHCFSIAIANRDHQLQRWFNEDVKPKLNTGKWIPVSEGLPEKNMACLVAVGKYNLTQMAMYSDLMGTIDHRIFYQGDYADDNFENITQYVKAWMPLPEYKEVSE